MGDQIITLTDFTGGIKNAARNPLASPQNALWDGRDIEVLASGGFRARPGYVPVGYVTDGADVPILKLAHVRFPMNDKQALLVHAGENIYALLGPEVEGTAEELTALLDEAITDLDTGPISVAVLGDRVVIAHPNTVPLVYGRCHEDDGSDWMYPKAALLSLDGIHFEDITRYVCDPDPDTTVPMDGMTPTGTVAVCCDMPGVRALYFDMATGNDQENSATPTAAKQAQWFSWDYATRVNHQGTALFWVQNSTNTGHFSASSGGGGVAIGPATANPGIVPGLEVVLTALDGTTNHIVSVPGDGTGAGGVTLEVACANSAVTGIYGLELTSTNSIQTTEALMGGYSTIYSKTLPSWVTVAGFSVIQVIAGADLTGNGIYTVRFTISTNGAACIGFSIAERSGTTANASTAPIDVFESAGYGMNSPGFSAAGAVDIVMDLPASAISIDAAKNYLVKMDFKYQSVDTQTGGTTQTVPNPAFAPWQQQVNALGPAPSQGSFVQTWHVSGSSGYYTQDWTVNPAYTSWLAAYNNLQNQRPAATITQTTPTQSQTVVSGSLASGPGAGVYYKDHGTADFTPECDTQSVTGYTYVPDVSYGITKIEAPTQAGTPPSAVQVARTTTLSACDMAGVAAITGLAADYNVPTGTSAYVAMSFDGQNTWKVHDVTGGSGTAIATSSVTSVGTASGDMREQDIKSTITTWTKDASTVGHFNVANAAVLPGCIITFADLTTATILTKSGDGTGASSITISVDHATDSGLVSIAALKASDSGVKINQATHEVVTGYTTGGTSAAGSMETHISTVQMTNNAVVTKVGIHTAGWIDNNVVKFAAFHKDTDNLFTGTYLGTLNLAATGYQELTLITPYTVPASGTYYLGYYDSGSIKGFASGAGFYVTANDHTGDQAHYIYSGSYNLRVAYKTNATVTPTGLYAAVTNTIQQNSTNWSHLTSTAITETLNGASAWFARSWNKGNAAEEWWVYLSSAWRGTCRLNSSTWQYKNSGGTYTSATINSRLGALAQAFGVTQNQMTATQLAAINQTAYDSSFTAGTSDLAIGLQASGDNIPVVSSWSDTYVPVVFPIEGWHTIAQDVAGTWKYWNGNALVSATTNNVDECLQQAMALGVNQWAVDDMVGLTPELLLDADGFNPEVGTSIDFATALIANGSLRPSVRSYTVNYTGVGTAPIKGYSGGRFTAGPEGSLWLDSTAANSVPFAQTGSVEYYANDTDADPSAFPSDYCVFQDVAGYWFTFVVQTSTGTKLSRILYSAKTQALSNIGIGQATFPLATIYHDVTAGLVKDYTQQLSEFTYSTLTAADVALDTAGFLYIGDEWKFYEIDITPFEPNAVVASLRGQYWNGMTWVDTVLIDGTSLGGKPFRQKGRITFPPPEDWHSCIPFNANVPRAYYLRIYTTAAFTTGTQICDCRVCPVPPDLTKYRMVSTVDNSVVLVGRSDCPAQIDVSRPWEEYGWFGQQAASYVIGAQDSIDSVTPAWNSLFLGKKDTWVQFKKGDAGDYSTQSVEASRHLPVNSEVVIKAPVQGQDGTKYGLAFLNRHGAFISTGLQTDNVLNTSRGFALGQAVCWWQPEVAQGLGCLYLDLDNLNLAQGAYFPPRNYLVFTVPMLGETDDPQTPQNTHLLIGDLNLGCWLPPWRIPVASLCLGYGANGSPTLFAGTYHGTVLRLFEGTTDQDYDIDGQQTTEAAIDWSAKTGWLSFGDPQFTKEIRRLVGYGTADDYVNLDIRTDGSHTVDAKGTVTLDEMTAITGADFGFGKPPEVYSTEIPFNFLQMELSGTGPAQVHGLMLSGNLKRDVTE